VSHRGGKPGFVRIESDRSFVFPDFAGNNHFNTLGNIQLNPKAGILFIDFETGDLVYMTGVADVIWKGEEVRAFAGAERLIRYQAEEVIRVEGNLPLRFGFGDYSPMLARTGDWTEARERMAAGKERDQFVPYEVYGVKRESETISSFYLRRVDGKSSASYEPGQFLPIRIRIPGEEEAVIRTYTLSAAPGQGNYRLSIKREGGKAVASTFLHVNARPGFRLEAMAPRGKFVLDRSSERPVVLISAGVGITPMISMLDFIVGEGLRTRNFRRVFFIHGARDGKEQAFGGHVRELASAHESVTAHIRLSRPREDDRLGETYDSEGRVDVDLLKSVLPLDDYEFYLCGPGAFMRELHGDLLSLGVRSERIFTESFGPSVVLGPSVEDGVPATGGKTFVDSVSVRFDASGIEAEWLPGKGTLLELAEAAGLSPEYSCRSGICGTCAAKVKCGVVDYLEEPIAAVADDEILLCCATPRPGDNPETGDGKHRLVLDL
jgi:ferredoxin-NADP reductase